MAEYPGLGMPISSYGWSDGQAALGPYAFLPQKPQAAQTDGGANGKPAATGFTGSTTAGFGLSPNATSYMDSVISGQNVPYNQGTKDAEMSKATDMAGAAESANNQRATSAAVQGGASGKDPSLQGSLMQNQQNRQGQTQQAQQQIDSQASVANQHAQFQAAQAEQQYGLESQRLSLEQQRLAMGFLPGMSGGGGRHGLYGLQGGNEGFIQYGADNKDPYGQGTTSADSGLYDPSNNSGYYAGNQFVNTSE